MSAPVRRAALAASGRLTQSGFCAFPATTGDSHAFCHGRVTAGIAAPCSCACHGELAAVPPAEELGADSAA